MTRCAWLRGGTRSSGHGDDSMDGDISSRADRQGEYALLWLTGTHHLRRRTNVQALSLADACRRTSGCVGPIAGGIESGADRGADRYVIAPWHITGPARGRSHALPVDRGALPARPARASRGRYLGKLRFGDSATAVATAISASSGVASGRVAFESARVKVLAAQGEPVILVRPEVSTDDIAGFASAAGILTAIGGRTAHAAVVARQMGKACLVGCRALRVDAARREARLAGKVIVEGDWISLDGATGEIFLGRREIISERPAAELTEIAKWQPQSL